ncbi:MAG: GDP-mannose 4,6-dehydratase [bacterium]|nr:GDP-mannose 4,6-dehydratase [Candidatus Sumerlaeota bacterium]
MAKKAFITGITGQDGYYLADFLLDKGYDVYGLVRSSSLEIPQRIGKLAGRVHIDHGDLTDSLSIREIIERVQPDEIYNLAAQSHVQWSFKLPENTFDTTGSGCIRMLEAIRQTCPQARFYQASSSEMFGLVQEVPQRETTPFHPRSPYGVAKVAAFWATINYREGYNMFACNGILFNHESPRRGEDFVTRKITKAAARIALGLQDKLILGNLDVKRDWGYAPEYVRAMWLMLQQETPEDYVIATGETHTVREFCEIAFRRAGLDWEKHVEIDPRFFRPAEVNLVIGDASKAMRQLGWEHKTSFPQLVEIMVDADLEAARQEAKIP